MYLQPLPTSWCFRIVLTRSYGERERLSNHLDTDRPLHRIECNAFAILISNGVKDLQRIFVDFNRAAVILV